jgi:uncharacterized protein
MPRSAPPPPDRWDVLRFDTHHRPWPIPQRPWLLRMRWNSLLFAHWPVDPARVRPLLPPGVDLDTFDGQAWMSVVAFDQSDTSLHGFPNVPWVSRFPECNTRTYVRGGDLPGILFLSLDAAQPLVVELARLVNGLPYAHARMTIDTGPAGVHFFSERRDRRVGPGRLDATYAPTGPAAPAPRGSLAEWLTERYAFFSQRHDGRLLWLEITHPRWQLAPVALDLRANTLGAPWGLDLAGPPTLAHVVGRQDVIAWNVQPFGRRQRATPVIWPPPVARG